MGKYVCLNCEHRFEEPTTVEETMERYLDIPTVGYSHGIVLHTCPKCGGEDYLTSWEYDRQQRNLQKRRENGEIVYKRLGGVGSNGKGD